MDVNHMVECWGNTRDSAVQAPYMIRMLPDSLSVGNKHSCAVSQFYILFCWGWNKYGQNDLWDDIDADIGVRGGANGSRDEVKDGDIGNIDEYEGEGDRGKNLKKNEE